MARLTARSKKAQTKKQIRLRGALKLCAGAAVFAAVFAYVLHKGLEPSGGSARLSIGLLIAMGAPGAYALSGLLELLLGISFSQLCSAWDSLRGWQRGLLGVLVVALAILALFGSVFVLGTLGVI